MSETQTFSAGTVERIGNILKITYTKKEVISIGDQKEITGIREKLFGKEKYVCLVDMRAENLQFTDEARKYVTYNKTIKKLRIAEVLLVNNFAEELLIHSYVRFARSEDKVTVMSNEEDAIFWLNTQYDKEMITA
ncbi:hypothetical protein K6119_11785 [Paracrocinitomix mangrovi]|uniref:DUF7793 family protein n=1 Tax=Paracrocinitomix mangrovi TaxID=2862509 RepID=UPI001C8DDE3F|nr:hypothetical protein [Paracrocinitomix mangrovi]UKN00414.1 hypothetical protein K6119_11785 [Paracrocinitomix mangrovi]